MYAKDEDAAIFNILIVDDVPKNIQVVASILQNEGYRMAFAQNGIAALEQVRSNKFDLILLDIMMPGMDGFMVCEEIKKDPASAETPVIFLTARTETDDIVRGFNTGGVDYVTKPFNGQELLARVKTHLALRYARERLRSANSELKTLNATKDKFFSIIAHDLRNPIQSLIMSSEILMTNFQQLEPPKVEEYIEKFNENANHIAALLENLMEWSRSQRGQVQVIPHRIDINLVTDQCMAIIKEQAALKGVNVVNGVPQNILAFADQSMIYTILRNLISNGVKFTSKGGEVTVTTREVNGLIEIAVSDSGIGISRDTQANLFRIDQHISSRGTDGERGTGLGLVLCKEFLEKNNGSIRLESEPDKGSTFYVTIPKYGGEKK